MPDYVALLRGINLGPRNRIAMADLRELLRGLGHEEVRTFIVSGNAIFSSRRRAVPALETEIEGAIRDHFGLDIRVLIRSARQLAAIVDDNPLTEAVPDGAGLFVLFLDRDPSPERITAIDAAAFEPEAFRLGDRVIYLKAERGLAGSKLATVLTDKRLGVTVTNRNWNTVTKLLALTTSKGASHGLDA